MSSGVPVTEQLAVGDKVYFESEKKPYTVKACNDQFAICTKPFNLKKTGLYTIIDWKQGKRNKNNLIFNPYDYMIQKDVEQCLFDLSDPKHVCEISQRGAVKLGIIRIERSS